MEVVILKNKKDYKIALQRFEEVFLADSKTKEGKEAGLLALVIKDYEDKQFKITTTDPVEAIKFKMQQLHLSNKELGKILGYRSRASEVLNRRRKLTIGMVRNLHKKLNIPLASLIKDY